MEFKKLDLKPEGTWFQRAWRSVHIRRTLGTILLGMVVGAILFFVLEPNIGPDFNSGKLIENIVMGGMFGLLITNSPCARGRC